MRALLIACLLVTVIVPAFGLASASYQDGNWKIVDAMVGGDITPMTVDQARRKWVGRTQRFAGNSARGPFLECRNGDRMTEIRYLDDVSASADHELREEWFRWGVKLSGTGVFIVSMKCEIPNTRNSYEYEFLQTGDNQTAYFGLDGMISKAIRVSFCRTLLRLATGRPSSSPIPTCARCTARWWRATAPLEGGPTALHKQSRQRLGRYRADPSGL